MNSVIGALLVAFVAALLGATVASIGYQYKQRVEKRTGLVATLARIETFMTVTTTSDVHTEATVEDYKRWKPQISRDVSDIAAELERHLDRDHPRPHYPAPGLRAHTPPDG